MSASATGPERPASPDDPAVRAFAEALARLVAEQVLSEILAAEGRSDAA